MNNSTNIMFALLLAGLSCAGCASPRIPPAPGPIPYLAVKRPDNVIKTAAVGPMRKEFSRSRFYILTYNCRPAPDVASYIGQTGQAAGTDILRNADVQLAVPCYVGPIIFGIGVGTRDSVTTAGK
jgi:hypothetical protein